MRCDGAGDTGQNHPGEYVPDSAGDSGRRLDRGRELLERKLEVPLTVVQKKVKPLLRGWLHAGTFPLSVVVGTLLVIFAPDERARISAAIFAGTASLLFGVSALYHRREWSPRVDAALQRFDHANIFLIIAGTYTPFAVLLLHAGTAKSLLWIVWSGALIGVLFRVFWVGAPRWLYVPVYFALGWVAIAYIPQLLAGGGLLVFLFAVIGGALYTLGGVVYGLRRPDPSPRWFGFHEVFHAFTVLAFAAHCVGISIAMATVVTPT